MCWTNVWPAAVIKEQKKGDTGNFMPCCSVTQSQEVGQRVAAGKKTIRRPNLGAVVFDICLADTSPPAPRHLIYSDLLTVDHDAADL